MTLTLRTLTGGTVAAAVWFIPGTAGTVTTRMTHAEYDAWVKGGGIAPGQPDPTAVLLVAGLKKALDTADGYASVGDCWVDDLEDPATGETVQALHVATGTDEAGHWGYTCTNLPGVGKQVIATCQHRHYVIAFDKANPAQTAVALNAPTQSMSVKPAVIGGKGQSWGTTPVNQAQANWTSGASFAVTVTAPTAGNFVGCCAAVGGGSFVVSSISQTNVSWPGAADVVKFASRDAELWSVMSAGASAGTTVTFNLSGTPPNGGGIVFEFNYGTATASLDQTASGTGGPGTAPSQALTPTGGINSLTVMGLKATVYAGAVASGGFTAFTDSGVNAGPSAAYRVDASASGPYTCTWTGLSAWNTVAASYNAAAAGGSTWGPSLSDQWCRIVQGN